MARKPATSGPDVDLMEIETGTLTLSLVGTSPLILNAVSEKTRRILLLPEAMRRKTAADRAGSLKHDPIQEYRDSIYRSKNDAPTRIHFPAGAMKRALLTSALRMQGAVKTEVGQLSWVEGVNIPIYGRPQMLMAVTRSADMSRTPDVRTRAILPEWTCDVTISFIKPTLQPKMIVNLLHLAGLVCGIGDYRQEKLNGSFGQWRLAQPEDEDRLRIRAEGGIVEQDDGLANPLFYDHETEALYSWFADAVKKVQVGPQVGAPSIDDLVGQEMGEEVYAAPRKRGRPAKTSVPMVPEVAPDEGVLKTVARGEGGLHPALQGRPTFRNGGHAD